MNALFSSWDGKTEELNFSRERILKSQAKNLNESNNFKIYPNPIVDVVNIDFETDITKISVFNLLGQGIITKSFNSNKATIDVSSLHAGTYIIKVVSDQQIKIRKIVKQ